MQPDKLTGMTADEEYSMSNMFSAVKAKTHDLGGELRRRSKKICFGTYDFAVHGGDVSSITLVEGAFPENAVVTDIFVDVETPVTSDGAADVQLLAGSTALVDDTDYGDGTNGVHGAGVFKYSALASSATAIRLSASSDLILAITEAALTAGKVHYAIEYYVTR